MLLFRCIFRRGSVFRGFFFRCLQGGCSNGSPCPALLNGGGGKFACDLLKASSVFKILAQCSDLLGRDVGAAVPTVLPALVSEVWAAAHDIRAIGRGLGTVGFGERSEFDGGERGEFGQGGLAGGVRGS